MLVYIFKFSFKVLIECPMDCKLVYLPQGTRNIVLSRGWKQAVTSPFGSSTFALFKCACNLDADMDVHSNDVCHLLHCRCEKLFSTYHYMRCHVTLKGLYASLFIHRDWWNFFLLYLFISSVTLSDSENYLKHVL